MTIAGMKLRALIVLVLAGVALATIPTRAAEDNSLGAKIKRLFHRSTPTPTPRKKARKASTPAVKSSPSPAVAESSATPSATAIEPATSPSPAEAPAPESVPESSAAATAAPISSTELAATESETTGTIAQSSRGSKTQYYEPVRPITPPPGARTRKSPRPERQPEATRSAETPNASASIAEKKPSGTITSADVSDYDSYSGDVRKVLDLGLDLANRNLPYKINSADPDKGGMDGSGFVYYVLSNAGVKDVPRDARDQYIWARKSGAFQAVLSQRDDTFELDALKPGDLLFWANTYGTNRDPDVTETMIYLGREKGTNQRLMVGASDGRTIKAGKKTGVGVFDFKVGRARKKEGETGPAFVGYARIPGLAE